MRMAGVVTGNSLSETARHAGLRALSVAAFLKDGLPDLSVSDVHPSLRVQEPTWLRMADLVTGTALSETAWPAGLMALSVAALAVGRAFSATALPAGRIAWSDAA